jgi:hypothetical protein
MKNHPLALRKKIQHAGRTALISSITLAELHYEKSAGRGIACDSGGNREDHGDGKAQDR